MSTDPTNLSALAQRIEGGAPDDTLLADIALALGWRHRDGEWCEWWNPGRQQWVIGPPDWLGSLDAAMSLAIEGWRIGNCYQATDGRFVFVVADPRLNCVACAPTLACAMTAAWVRARINTHKE